MDANSYINREISWLEFNRRVLEEAKDESVPLLERVKFLAIFSSNLDEFLMVRVAGLKRQILDGDQRIDPDGWTPAETLSAISKRVHELAEEQHLCFLNTILPQLTAEGIHLVRPEEMSGEQEHFLEEFFHRTLYPIVTPLAIDPGHPFPYLANRSLCLVVSLRPTTASRLPHTDLSIVHIPTQVALRFITVPSREGQQPLYCLRMHYAITYRGFTMVLRFSLATPFASRATLIF
jgi:polyphosphate kinase